MFNKAMLLAKKISTQKVLIRISNISNMSITDFRPHVEILDYSSGIKHTIELTDDSIYLIAGQIFERECEIPDGVDTSNIRLNVYHLGNGERFVHEGSGSSCSFSNLMTVNYTADGAESTARAIAYYVSPVPNPIEIVYTYFEAD